MSGLCSMEHAKLAILAVIETDSHGCRECPENGVKVEWRSSRSALMSCEFFHVERERSRLAAVMQNGGNGNHKTKGSGIV